MKRGGGRLGAATAALPLLALAAAFQCCGWGQEQDGAAPQAQPQQGALGLDAAPLLHGQAHVGLACQGRAGSIEGILAGVHAPEEARSRTYMGRQSEPGRVVDAVDARGSAGVRGPHQVELTALSVSGSLR